MKKSILRTISLLILAFFILSWFLVSVKNKHIKSVFVDIDNASSYISKQEIINKFLYINKSQNWIDTDLSNLVKYFNKKQGVDDVFVKKEWPSKIVVYLHGFRPIAYWGDNDILLDNMSIISPDTFTYDFFMPRFYAPENSKQDILNIYKQLENIAEQYNHNIKSIFYEGGQYSLLLGNDMKIYLGGQNIKYKLTKFFIVARKILDNDKSAHIFDMRYKQGIAVR